MTARQYKEPPMPPRLAIPLHLRRAETLASAGRYDQALRVVQNHLLDRPGDPRGLHLAASILQAMGRFDQAAQHLRRALAAVGEPEPAS